MSLESLKKQLIKVEKQLEKHRSNVAVFSIEARSTQKRWKSERNWDYYANEKFRILGLIEEQNEKTN